MFYYVNTYSASANIDRHVRCRTQQQAERLVSSMRAIYWDLQAWINDLPA